MCGRYTITITDVADHFKAEQGAFEFTPSYNIAPTQQVPIVLEREGERPVSSAVNSPRNNTADFLESA